MRYKLLDAPGDFHVAAAGLAGVWDEIDDVQDLVGIGCGQLEISCFTDSSRIGRSSVSRAASATAASCHVKAAKG